MSASDAISVSRVSVRFLLGKDSPVADSAFDLSLITATWRRPKLLAHCLQAVAGQQLGGLKLEHIVVSDGPDRTAEALCAEASARFVALEEHAGNFGATARDRGIELARGRYLAFWDDDNLYEPFAAAVQFAAAQQADVGVVRVKHWSVTQKRYRLIPQHWNGKARPGHIDTMCLCVRRELAQSVLWQTPPTGRGTDHRWLSRVLQRNPQVRFSPQCIGAHLAFD